MCTALDGLQQMKTATVRVRCLVENQLEQRGVFTTGDDDGEQIVGVLAQQNGPASRWEDESSADGAVQGLKECSVRGQREQRGAEHGLDEMAPAAGDPAKNPRIKLQTSA